MTTTVIYAEPAESIRLDLTDLTHKHYRIINLHLGDGVRVCFEVHSPHRASAVLTQLMTLCDELSEAIDALKQLTEVPS